MFVLFIFHHLLNRNWYSNLFRGKYTPLRILQTAADVLLLAAMIGLMVSGIILSRVVIRFSSHIRRHGICADAPHACLVLGASCS